MAGGMPDFELEVANLDGVAIVDAVFDGDGRHVEVDVLGSNLSEGGELVARFEVFGGERMGGDRGFENLFGFGEALDVVDVGVRGDERLAFAKRKVEFADEVDDVVDGVFVADVEEGPCVVVVDQVGAAGDAAARLMVEFDDVGEEGSPLEHGSRSSGEWAVGSGQFFVRADSTGSWDWNANENESQ